MTNTTEAAIVATTDARLLTGSADDWRLGIAAAPAVEEREDVGPHHLSNRVRVFANIGPELA